MDRVGEGSRRRAGPPVSGCGEERVEGRCAAADGEEGELGRVGGDGRWEQRDGKPGAHEFDDAGGVVALMGDRPAQALAGECPVGGRPGSPSRGKLDEWFGCDGRQVDAVKYGKRMV